VLTKLLLGKGVNGAGSDTYAALIDDASVDIPHDLVRLSLLFGGLPDEHDRVLCYHACGKLPTTGLQESAQDTRPSREKHFGRRR
jgi:hypothetical protein